MRRVRLAIVSDALYPWHKGGKEIRYQHLFSRLPDLNMDVTVYSMKWWDENPQKVISPNGSLSFCSICRPFRMYRGSRRSLIQATFFAISTFRLLGREMDVIEADHMPYLQLLPLRIVAWMKRVPLVITWHEVWGKSLWKIYLGRFGATAALVEKFCAKLPDSIIAVSGGTAEKLITIGVKKTQVKVIPNALDVDLLLSIEPNPASPEIIFVGRLIEHKHADWAISAVRIMVEKGLDVHLGIIGIGPEEARLREQVADLELDDHVTFLLTINDQRELWSLVRGCHVVLAPSTREGFGIFVAESLVLGTPVVGVAHRDNESAKLISEEVGSLVAPFDIAAMAIAAERWLKDSSSRENRVAFFLEHNRDLSVDAMATSYAEVVRNSM